MKLKSDFLLTNRFDNYWCPGFSAQYRVK